ncbi:unnamed protein product [Camellia sinensis]
MILNIISQFGFYSRTSYSLQVHPTVEAFKHVYAVRMNLGDPDFVNVSSVVSNMLSPEFAARITSPSGIKPMTMELLTFVVDSAQNVVSMNTSPNDYYGSRFQSQSTGIVLNNEMGDFSGPRSFSPPPAPSNYIQPFKRALPSMTPTIVLKGRKLKKVLGGAGGINMTTFLLQRLINSQCTVLWTSSLGDQYAVIVNAQEEGQCHALHSVDGRTICQLVARKLEGPNSGMLVAANDLREGGFPAGY